MKKDLNDIAKYEVAISKKYGKEAIQHPKADWDDEKEKEYQQQIKICMKKKKSKKKKTKKLKWMVF
jgi:galactose-1-phosphate uridylyltransferase